MLRIPAEAKKGNKDRLLPIAPEFAEFLEATPPTERRGRVLKLESERFGTGRLQSEWVSKVITKIGCKAGVVVDQRPKSKAAELRKSVATAKGRSKAAKPKKQDAEQADDVQRKYASAHDLRRAFGLRWAGRLKPNELQQLMRHEAITTTLKYYVGQDAEAVAEAMWAAIEATLPASGDTSGDTPANEAVASNGRRGKDPIK